MSERYVVCQSSDLSGRRAFSVADTADERDEQGAFPVVAYCYDARTADVLAGVLNMREPRVACASPPEPMETRVVPRMFGTLERLQVLDALIDALPREKQDGHTLGLLYVLVDRMSDASFADFMADAARLTKPVTQ